jgi:hypothetical protein
VIAITPPTAENPSGSPGINLDPNSDITTNAVLSFKFRAPLGIEPWDIFEFHVHGTTLGEDGTADTEDDGLFIIQIRPIQPPAGSCFGGMSSTMNMGTFQARLLQEGSSNAPMLIQVDIGRNFLDGSWHTVWLDLNEINQKANDGSVPANWELATASQIMIGGQMFRLDDIIFRRTDYTIMQPPDIIESGPRYAQIFDPYRYLFMAEYGTDGTVPPVNELLLDSDNFLVDTNAIIDAWLQDSNDSGIIQMDTNYLDPNHSSYGEPEPYYSDLLGRDFIIDINLPIFTDPEFRIGGTKAAKMRTQALGWNATIGSYGANGVQTVNQFGLGSIVQPLPINPFDGMPTYIMLYYYTDFKAIHSENRFPSNSFNKAQYGPIECFILESALWNAGLAVWPHIAFMDFTPLYFEDLIMTIEVTNGSVSDVETIPISVVNYPVENYPPVVQMRICPRVFYVGERGHCSIRFADPDCLIFSLAQFQGGTPATSHVPNLPGNVIRDDQDQLIYQMTINGLSSYQYGPWIDTIINPCNGETSFIPKFEGLLQTVVTCTDNRGASGVGRRPLYLINRGTWLNHPPIMTRMPVRPIVIRAGEEFILTHPQLMVEDPDGDELYASCNIGSVGKTASGKFIWTFQTNFPGFYNVEVVFYDIRGGYAIMKIMVEVKPWWSY